MFAEASLLSVMSVAYFHKNRDHQQSIFNAYALLDSTFFRKNTYPWNP